MTAAKKRRVAWIKQHGPCVSCYSWENLEVDHINSADKQYQIARIWSWSEKKYGKLRQLELSKCQVLCRSCHLIKTWKQDRKKATHATDSMYSLGCRCVPCTAAHAMAVKAYRSNRRLALTNR